MVAAGEFPSAPLPPPPGEGADDQSLPSPLTDVPHTWYQPAYWLDITPWDTGVELGLNGSTGTNESTSIRTGGYVKYKTPSSKFNFSSYYNRTTTGGATTQNNAQMDLRNDWSLGESSPWTWFGSGNLFYDEFQAFYLQVNANTGIGYNFVDEPEVTLVGRLGGGTSREFGGPDDRWVPESLVGFQYDQELSPTLTSFSKFEYYPDWDQLGEYRLLGEIGCEIALVQPSNLSMKISATDRFDSTSNGSDPHLVNYSVLLLLKL